MTRRGFFGLLAAKPYVSSDLQPKVVAFEKFWDPFVRKLFGCSPDPTVPINHETCVQSRSEIDYTLFTKSRKAAANIFDFSD
jgi:hypothetical protein